MFFSLGRMFLRLTPVLLMGSECLITDGLEGEVVMRLLCSCASSHFRLKCILNMSFYFYYFLSLFSFSSFFFFSCLAIYVP